MNSTRRQRRFNGGRKLTNLTYNHEAYITMKAFRQIKSAHGLPLAFTFSIESKFLDRETLHVSKTVMNVLSPN